MERVQMLVVELFLCPMSLFGFWQSCFQHFLDTLPLFKGAKESDASKKMTTFSFLSEWACCESKNKLKVCQRWHCPCQKRFDGLAILPVIQDESHWWFKAARHELVQMTIFVARQIIPMHVLRSCASGHASWCNMCSFAMSCWWSTSLFQI